MVAFFHNAALVHHDNFICILDGGKPVCNDDGRPAFHQLSKRILNQRLGLRIDIGSCLIKDKHGRLECERPRKGQKLPCLLYTSDAADE